MEMTINKVHEKCEGTGIATDSFGNKVFCSCKKGQDLEKTFDA